MQTETSKFKIYKQDDVRGGEAWHMVAIFCSKFIVFDNFERLKNYTFIGTDPCNQV